MTISVPDRRPPAALHSLHSDGEAVAAILRIGDREHPVSYRVSGSPIEPSYDPFLIAMLPVAMRVARSLSVPEPVSPRLLGAVDEVQAILSAWFSDLSPVEVDAEPGAPEPAPDRGTAAFFSGGVDSFYTAIRHVDSLGALVFVPRFEIGLVHDSAKRARVMAAVRSAAAELDVPLIEVETNLRETSDPLVPWWRYAGAALASVGVLLGATFRRVLLPASHSYRDLYPWGTTALLDPKWSTDDVEIIHEGCADRTEKVAAIASSDVAMRWLRVCHSEDAYNCGQCEKCIRTIVNLELAGALGRCTTLPARLPPYRAIARTPVVIYGQLLYARENLDAARATGADPALRRALWCMVGRGMWHLWVRPRLKRPFAAPG